ncbi:MAG: DUF177 domain-containing protein [Nitrospirae bacterium]|nr:DUF177 domain-containing protein [Candidatus Manganitrophaceae bacterium]
MEIKINDIPPEGLLLTYEEGPEEFDLSKSGFAIKGNIHVLVKAIKHNEEDVYVRGAITAEIVSECSRCLKPLTNTIESDFQVEYVPRTSVPEGEQELVQEELDLLFYDGETINIREEVEGQLILSTPMRPLCREDCRGLCPQCGQDLNVRQCNCVVEAPDPRWAGLKEIFENKKKSS